MDPKQTIKKNIERRSKFVDVVPLHKNVPIPTWIELSLIDVCNRKCSFCPKADDKVAPDTFQKMTRKIIDEIHDQLLEIHFTGTISLCGYGEPLLHKDITYIVKKLSNVSNVEIITNGDVLSSKRLQDLYLANASKVLVSMYDGPEQIEKFEKMKKNANVPEDLLILRDRWYDKYNDFGVKLTNRAGTINTGIQEKVDKNKTCFYPTYQCLIDWNGNVYLCPQDWQRKVSSSFNNGSRDGKQIFSSFKYTKKPKKNLKKNISIYSKFDLGFTQLDSYTETGSSELIHYNNQYIKQATLGIGSNVSKVIDFKDGFFIPFVNFEAGGNIANISDAESSYTTSSSVSSYKIKNDNTSFCKLNIGFEADLYDNWEIKFSYDYYEEMTSENNRENQIQFTVVKKLMN